MAKLLPSKFSNELITFAKKNEFYHKSIINILLEDLKQLTGINESLLQTLEQKEAELLSIQRAFENFKDSVRKALMEASAQELIKENHMEPLSENIPPITMGPSLETTEKAKSTANEEINEDEKTQTTSEKTQIDQIEQTNIDANFPISPCKDESSSRKRTLDFDKCSGDSSDENDAYHTPKRSFVVQTCNQKFETSKHLAFPESDDCFSDDEGQKNDKNEGRIRDSTNLTPIHSSRRSISNPELNIEHPSSQIAFMQNYSAISIAKRNKENAIFLSAQQRRNSSSVDSLCSLGFSHFIPSTPTANNKSLFQHQHSFEIRQRNFIRAHCSHCHKLIRFATAYVKCIECKAMLHIDCRQVFIAPCNSNPTPATPNKITLSKAPRQRLGDYCTDRRPMVPQILISCSTILEQNLPINEDIYVLNGDEKEVSAILNLFKLPANNNINKIPLKGQFHPVNLAGAIMTFLKHRIRDPIIPYSYGEELIGVLETNRDLKPEDIWRVVEELPTAHMDSLGYMCQHFNRIITNSSTHTTEIISESMGPIFFGADRLDAQQNKVKVSRMASIKALNYLLNLDWIERERCKTPTNLPTTTNLTKSLSRPAWR